MGIKCTVEGCRSGYRATANHPAAPQVTLHKFPADPAKCAAWVKALGRSDVSAITKNMGVCELHFDQDRDYKFESTDKDRSRWKQRMKESQGLLQRKFLRPEAVPSYFGKALVEGSKERERVKQGRRREERAEQR